MFNDISALRLAAARKGDVPASKKGDPAIVAGKKLSSAQLRAFVGIKKGKKERGVAESDNPRAFIKIIDFNPLSRVDLENLADLVDSGHAIIELQVIGQNPPGQLKGGSKGGSTSPKRGKGDIGTNPPSAPKAKNHGGGMSAKKGKGDVGSSSPGSVRKKNSGSQTKPNSKGDIGRNRGGKENTRSKHGSETSAKAGTGDIGTRPPTAARKSSAAAKTQMKNGMGSNPSGTVESESIADLIVGKPQGDSHTEDVERGYPNAEPLTGGSGPDLEGKIPQSRKRPKKKVKLPANAGNHATGKAKSGQKKVNFKASNNHKVPMPGRFGMRLDSQEWADGIEDLEGIPTTIEGIMLACEPVTESFKVFHGPGSLVTNPEQSTSQSRGRLDILSLQANMPTGGTDGIGAAPGNKAPAADAVDKMMVVVARAAPAAAKEARSILKAVLPSFKKISALGAEESLLAITAIDTRIDLLGFDGSKAENKLRRGLRGVMKILRTPARRSGGRE